jgi:molecular chaperone HtpG
MREQFTVDLRGLVEILSHHLYSSERVYLRELLQNAHDALKARARLGHDFTGSIEIVPARGYEQLVVRDNGVGLTEADMRSLLSIIGSTSKRDDLALARRNFLGQFGIGLLSCFLVADSIEVVSRSAAWPNAPTVRWVGQSDGTFTVGDALEPLPAPGTEVRLRPRHGFHRWCDTDACTQFAGEFAELLDVPVRVVDTTVSGQTPPWRLSTEQQLEWCRERFGFEAMGIIPFDEKSANVVGLAFVLPYTARPGYRTGDRIYSKGMLVADTDDLVVPRWAFFCRAVIDAGNLPLTASREGLQESAALQFVRKQIGFRLLTELIIVQNLHPEVYRDIIRLHADGLKTLAVNEPDVRDLLRSTLPYETTSGDRTIQQLVDSPDPVPYVRDADTFHALAEVATQAGVLVVNAGGLHEADLLQIVDDVERGHFREVTAANVVELARPVPHPDVDAAEALAATATAALPGEDVEVVVASFEPADRPVLWWPTDAASADADGLPPGRLVLNSANSSVKRLLGADRHADISAPLRALYVTGLLFGRMQPTNAQVSLLRNSVLDMIENSLAYGDQPRQ